MIEQYGAPGRLPARGGRDARSRSTARREVRLGDGPVPHGRPGRQRHRLGDPQAPLRRAPEHASTRAIADRSASWAASGRRPARAGTTTSRATATPSPIRKSNEMIAQASKRDRDQAAARSATRRSSSGWSTRSSTKAARILEEGIALRASDIDMVYLTGYGFPAVPRRADVLRRHRGPAQRAARRSRSSQKGYQGQVWKPAPLLAKLAKEGKRFNG